MLVNAFVEKIIRVTAFMPDHSPPTARQTPLDFEQVVGQAIAFADQHGLAALSMRKLGQQLSVEAMSLYHYVANKQALQGAMLEQVLAEIHLPAIGGDWQLQIRRWQLSAYEVLAKHPWVCQLLMSELNIGQNMLAMMDASQGCLQQAGFSLMAADHARVALMSHLYGFVLQQQQFPLDQAQYQQAAEHFLQQLDAEKMPYMHGLTCAVAEGQFDGRNDFSHGLELLLQSLAIRRQYEG